MLDLDRLIGSGVSKIREGRILISYQAGKLLKDSQWPLEAPSKLFKASGARE